MGNFFKNYAFNSLMRTIVSVVAQAIATKLALDATQTADFTTWLLAGISQAIVFVPIAYNQLTRPSNAAMDAAVGADKIIAGEEVKIDIATPVGKPDVAVVNNTNANIGHS